MVLDGTSEVTTTATFNIVFGVLLDEAATGTITVKGNEAAFDPEITAFTIAPSATSVGLEVLTTAMVVDGDTVNWTTSPGGYALLIGTDNANAAAIEKIDLFSTGTTSTSWNAITAIAQPFDTGTLGLSADMFVLDPSTYPYLSSVTERLDTLAG